MDNVNKQGHRLTSACFILTTLINKLISITLNYIHLTLMQVKQLATVLFGHFGPRFKEGAVESRR